MPALVLSVLAIVIAGPVGQKPAAGFAPLVTQNASVVATEKIGGERVVIAAPKQPTRRVAIFAHGAGRGAAGMINDTAPLVAALLARGYTVVASDAHGDAWGNRASRSDYIDLANAMRRRGLTRVFVLGRSMGGLASLATIPDIRPVAWAGIYPACNLKTLDPYRRSITRAWDMPWAQIQRLPGFNPVPPRGVRGLPMIFWASPEDTIVDKRRNTDRCAAAARRRGARVTVISTEGEHGDRSNMDPQRLVEFFDAAAIRAARRAPR